MIITDKRIKFKNITIAMAFGLAASIILCFAGFNTRCDDLRHNILRLHILANSNTDEDQALKLKVRDKILSESESIFSGAQNKTDAIKKANENLDVMTRAAESVIKSEGKNYPVTIEIGKSYFENRDYDNFSLPAGEYDAVRVLIGKHEGKNWWCVMFPSICIPSAENRSELDTAVSKSSAEIAENPVRYKAAFKTVEIYEDISKKIKEWFE